MANLFKDLMTMLKNKFMVEERIYVVEKSDSDFFGWCKVRLSDGGIIFGKYPIIGETARIKRHIPKVRKDEHFAQFLVETKDCGTVAVTYQDAVSMMEEYKKERAKRE